MESKRRVQNALNREKADRVPFDYSGNRGIDSALKSHSGLGVDEGLRKALGVDIRRVGAPYTGPPLHEQMADRRVEPCWGWRTRLVKHESGNY